MALNLPLQSYWANEILTSRARTVYHISRTEPFRLLACIPPKEYDPPITSVLIGRTVKTVISTLEPEQPNLVHSLIKALRAAAETKEPVRLQYRVANFGTMKTATVLDEGQDKPYLTIYCESD
jgi:hypothetical protein